MNQLEQQDSIYHQSRSDKPRRTYAPPQRDKDEQGKKRDWKNGRSKGHKLPCPICGGLLHERGRHLDPGVVRMMLAKQEREAERAAAGGAGQVVQAGQ